MKREQLQELYCDRCLSMTEVADELNITQAKVLYWLKKFDIARRSLADSSYVRQNPLGDPFWIPKKLTNAQKQLMIAALSLYWAEGNKGKDALRLANLDHKMILIFLKFLREVCHINEHRLHLYVRVYKDFSLEAVKGYWVDLLKITPDRILVYPHTDRRSKKDGQWSQYGIATLEFHNTKLKKWLDTSIGEMAKQLLM